MDSRAIPATLPILWKAHGIRNRWTAGVPGMHAILAPPETHAPKPRGRTMNEALQKIAEHLRTQDNRATQNPMFCVQIKRRDVGYDTNFTSHCCWHDSANDETIYDDDKGFMSPPKGDNWDEFGYVDRWETVMVAFTEAGCEEYLRIDGHNCKQRAHNGEVRIYVESFNRCPEMIAIRDLLINKL